MLAPRRKAAASCGAVALLTGSLVSAVAIAGPAAASGAAGVVYTWGSNDMGELDNGTVLTPNYVPAQAHHLAGITATAVAGGYEDSLMLTSTGAIYGWGDDDFGELGDGVSSTTTHVPVRTSLPAGVIATAIAAGDYTSLALASTGAVYAWGDNDEGGLGNGTMTSSDVPVQVSLPAGVTATAISAADMDGFALTSTGAIYAWGNNALGQLGNGTTTTTDVPVLVSLPAGVTAIAIAAAQDHTLAITSTGAVYAWGDNSNGQLGDGTTTNRAAPVLVGLPAGVRAVSVAGGQWHSVAATSTGKVYSWGDNSVGEVGDGTFTERHAPVLSSLPAGVTVTAVSAGYVYSLARTSTGSAYGWGNNEYGQLGNGTTDVYNDVPLQVSFPAGVTAASVVAGQYHTLAVTPSAPVVTAVAPTSGSTAGGTPVTVSGNGFTGATKVLFGSKVATSLVVVSNTKLTVVSPSHSAGAINVRVVTPAGETGVVAADQFTYRAAPRVSGVSPTSGPRAGGTSVTVTGSGFTGATQVLFGSKVATSLVVVSDTQLTVTSPAHSVGAIDVRVIAPAGKSSAVTADQFTYQ